MKFFYLIPFLLFLSLSGLSARYSSANVLDLYYANCAPYSYSCGDKSFIISYPFRSDNRRYDYCGYPNFDVNCTGGILTITMSNKKYQIASIDYDNTLLNLVDTDLVQHLCTQPFVNTTIDTSLFQLSNRNTNLTLFINCTAPPSLLPNIPNPLCGRHSYFRVDRGTTNNVFGGCSSTVVVPVVEAAATQLMFGVGFGEVLQAGFWVNWAPGMDWCSNCVTSGGRCGYNDTMKSAHICFCSNGTFIDSCYSNNLGTKAPKGFNSLKIAIGVIVSVAGFLSICAFCIFCYRRRLNQRPQRQPSSVLLGQTTSFTPRSNKDDRESISFHCDTPVFSYEELVEATGGFDRSNELGDGGYGTVYKGLLHDGRVVAVKRLYETSYKRVEQFVNEVKILSLLRHPNLLTLYGCTSPNSPHLLLVYEYISNGTLAHHLHDPVRSRSLPISLRLSMAIDTAAALSYLHSKDVIHRDVKSHNILVDQNYNVKVADFGLSRLFPANATHVSTAPQGTPGYLDPEYHRFYQLTDKSDVYSYGVVLMEMLASRPAVDVERKTNEISLAMMAINKIQKGELDKLVDPVLNYDCDQEVKRVVTRMAELAFRCLQMDREMRPSIKDVVAELKEIEIELNCKEKDGAKLKDNIRLLKSSSRTPCSPNSVMDKWLSQSTTPNISK